MSSKNKKIDNKNIVELVKKSVFAFLGQSLCGVGVAFFVFASLGVDPISVFTSGVAYQSNLSYGNALFFVQLILMLIVLIWDKSYLHIASFMAVFVIGYVVDFTMILLTFVLPIPTFLFIRLIYMFIGIFILAWGIPLYIQAGVGVSPVDCISEIIADKGNFPYKWVRMLTDLLFLVVGTLLGGALGIATIIVAFVLGPCISLTRPLINRYLYDKIFT